MSLFRKRFADGERLDLDGVPVRLVVNRRARRVSLRIDPRSGEVRATAPTISLLSDAAAFAAARRGWIAKRLADRPAPRPLLAGEEIRLFGTVCRLEPNGRRPRLAQSGDGARRLTGCGDADVDPSLVKWAIRREALGVYQRRVAHHCARLGAPPPAVGVSDGRTRWGSCTSASARRVASIRLSWRLALAPFEVADYVVAHECAHLIEANHSARFWDLVRSLVGDTAPHRAWLRVHGPRLHAFGQ